MSIQIVLIRGINVGGNNKLPMEGLRDLLRALGAEHVATYIQSGNAVVKGRPFSGAEITSAIQDAYGFSPKVLVLDLADFEAIAKANPFPEAEVEGKTLHVWFADGKPELDQTRVDALLAGSERLHATDVAVYLHAPDGIGRSKLAAQIERLAGVPTTARNWNTVAKLLQMAAEI